MVATKPATYRKPGCRPVTCPDCGDAACLERPRFFCGQLLTDKDLEAAQRYVIEKNRLHNRYQVGTGVVCGLAVRCHPSCEGFVVVEAGYGIDCCGNDIVLCGQEEFNVAEYLKKCFAREAPDCLGPIRTRLTSCDEGQAKDYYLILSYHETPANPITAYNRENGCQTARCEPSRTKETFRFDLVETKDYKPAPYPNLLTRLRDCLLPFLDSGLQFAKEYQALLNMGDSPARPAAAQEFLTKMRDYLADLYEAGPDTRCDLAAAIDRLSQAVQPAASHEKIFTANIPIIEVPGTTTLGPLALAGNLLSQNLIDCLCDALLVPCVPCQEPEGVILARLTVQDGKILNICNLARTQLITGPALRYWLGSLSNYSRQVLGRICCDQKTWPVWLKLAASYFLQYIKTLAARCGQLSLWWNKFWWEVIVKPWSDGFKRAADPNTKIGLDFYGLDPKQFDDLRTTMKLTIIGDQTKNTDAEAYAAVTLPRLLSPIKIRDRVHVLRFPDSRVAIVWV